MLRTLKSERLFPPTRIVSGRRSRDRRGIWLFFLFLVFENLLLAHWDPRSGFLVVGLPTGENLSREKTNYIGSD